MAVGLLAGGRSNERAVQAGGGTASGSGATRRRVAVGSEIEATLVDRKIDGDHVAFAAKRIGLAGGLPARARLVSTATNGIPERGTPT